MNHAVETAHPLVEAAGHPLSVVLPDQPVWLEGDPTRLEQVFANLLNNAAKYTEPGGRISLVASREGDEVVVRVVDTGIGLTPEMVGRVFDLFAQADRSLDRAQGGLGDRPDPGPEPRRDARRAACPSASDGPGQGSEFVVRLPVSDRVAPDRRSRPPLVRRPGPEGSGSCWSRTTSTRRLSLSRVLKLWGHAVRVAHNGPDALREVSEDPPERSSSTSACRGWMDTRSRRGSSARSPARPR